MSALYVAVMVVGLVGMIICSKKRATNPAMQPLSFVLFLVVLAGAFMWLRESGIIGSSSANTAVGKEHAFNEAKGVISGQFMKKAAPGRKVLAIATPGYENDVFLKTMLKSFSEEYGAEVAIDTIDVPEGADDGSISYIDLMSAKAIKEVIARHDGIGVILFITGFPERYKQMGIFSKKDSPAVFCYSRGQVTNKELVDAVKKGEITGLIVSQKKVDRKKEVKGSDQEIFDIRYVLISKDNIDSKMDFFK